jgi:hypothetical protein
MSLYALSTKWASDGTMSPSSAIAMWIDMCLRYKDKIGKSNAEATGGVALTAYISPYTLQVHLLAHLAGEMHREGNGQ